MTTQTACESCPVHNVGNLTKLGVDLDKTDFVIALAGNPNTGKSTVFNALTGLRQHTGNWPGKTVTRAEGAFQYRDKRYKIVDLPGTYSLFSTSTDEEIARNFILFGQPDVTIIVVDATRLERNLNLVLQVLEITDRAIVCVNLVDEAERHRISIDDRLLSKKLGVPVILTAARQNRGIDQLLTSIHDVVTGTFVCQPYRIQGASRSLERAIKELSEALVQRFPGLTNERWIALRLLDWDDQVVRAVQTGDLESLSRVSNQQKSGVPA